MRTLFTFFLSSFFFLGTYAQTTLYWTGSSSSDFGTAANWNTAADGTGATPGSAPGSSDEAVFTSNFSVNCNLNSNTALGLISITGYTGTLDLNDYNLILFSTSGDMDFNSGTITNSSTNTRSISVPSNFSGTVDLSGTDFTGSTDLELELYGSEVSISGGTLEAVISIESEDPNFSAVTFDEDLTITFTGSSAVNNFGGTTFNGSLTIINEGSAPYYLSRTNSDIFNADLTLSSTNGSLLLVGANNSANLGNEYNGNIIFDELTNGGEIRLGNAAGSGTHDGLLSINFNSAGDDGTVTIRGLTQETSSGSGTNTLNGGADIVFNIENSSFEDALTVTSYSMDLDNSVFDGAVTVTLEAGSIGSNTLSGGNEFNGTTTINHDGDGSFVWAGTTEDDFNADVVVNLDGGGTLRLANGGSNPSSFASDLEVNITSSTGAVFRFADGSGSAEVDGTFSISVSGSSDNDVLLTNTGNSIVLNGDFITECTSCDRFEINGGTLTLNSPGEWSIGTGGFSDGTVQFDNFIYTGSTAHNITFTTDAVFTADGMDFGGNLTLTAPQFNFENSQFDSDLTLDATGTSGTSSLNSSTIDGNADIHISGSGDLVLAGSSDAFFNGNLDLSADNASDMDIANQAGDVYIAGDFTFNFDNLSSFEAGRSGYLVFAPSGNQSFENLGSTPTDSWNWLNTRVDGAGTITLQDEYPMGAFSSFDFELADGVMITSSSAPLTLTQSATITGGSSDSYIDGPISRDMTQSDVDIFPVGTNGIYAPVTLELTSAASRTFTVSYNDDNQETTYGTTYGGSIQAVSEFEGWDIDVNNTFGNTVNVTLPWGAHSAVGDPSDVVIARWSGTQWDDLGASSTSGTAGSGSVTVNSVSTFSPFTLGSIDALNTPLPVELLSFEAYAKGDFNRLEWVTASEENNSHFEIQRSTNGNEWENIGHVQGHGTTFQTTHYEFNDLEPLAKTTYYRLKQIDFDGSFDHSPIRIISNDQINPITIYPIPLKGNSIIIEGDSIDEVMLTDIQGRTIHTSSVNKNGSLEFNIHESLPAGIYLLQMNINGVWKVEKLPIH